MFYQHFLFCESCLIKIWLVPLEDLPRQITTDACTPACELSDLEKGQPSNPWTRARVTKKPLSSIVHATKSSITTNPRLTRDYLHVSYHQFKSQDQISLLVIYLLIFTCLSRHCTWRSTQITWNQARDPVLLHFPVPFSFSNIAQSVAVPWTPACFGMHECPKRPGATVSSPSETPLRAVQGLRRPIRWKFRSHHQGCKPVRYSLPRFPFPKDCSFLFPSSSVLHTVASETSSASELMFI